MESKTIKITVGSRNPAKIRAVQHAFGRAFPAVKLRISGCDVCSGVADQPRGDDEALLGAMNRARAALKNVPTADYGVGIEGAVNESVDGMEAFAWAVVLSPPVLGKGRTATFYLPEQVAERVRNGSEMGAAVDAVFGTVGAKHKEGAIGLLTHGILDRSTLYEQGMIVALIPFLTPNLFSKSVRI